MKTVLVAEVRSNLSAFMREVESGNQIGISFGPMRQPIAVIVPIAEYNRIKERKLRSFAGKVNVEFRDDWKMSDEEFLNS